jgi:hypothetical protein
VLRDKCAPTALPTHFHPIEFTGGPIRLYPGANIHVSSDLPSLKCGAVFWNFLRFYFPKRERLVIFICALEKNSTILFYLSTSIIHMIKEYICFEIKAQQYAERIENWISNFIT